MYVSDDDRITPRPPRRSPAAILAALVVAIGGVAGFVYYYLNHADDSQRQQLAALQQAVKDVAAPPKALVSEPPPAPAPTPAPAPVAAPPAPDPVVASEPPAEPVAEAPPLPALDDSDAALRQELAGLSGWQASATALLVNDQLLRRFVTFVNTVAAGKVDHKNGPFQPIKGRFTVTAGDQPQMAAESSTRYNLYVGLVTAVDPQQCAALYRRYYPLLAKAYGELGEKGNFHSLVLKAIQVLDSTPALPTNATLTPGLKGMWKYADPQLEALPPAQKQLLRSGPENVANLKGWLRQLRAALLTPPA